MSGGYFGREGRFPELEAKESVAAEEFSAADLHSAPESASRVRFKRPCECASRIRQMLLPLQYGAFQLFFGRRRQASPGSRGMAQGIARLRHRFFAALWRDDLGDSIRGLQPHFSSPERADRDRGSDANAMGAAGGRFTPLLVAAFGWGVWQSAGRNRAVRIVGGLILAYASLGLLWPFAAMHQREVLAAGGGTLSDTMHVVLGGVTVFLMFLAIGFGATAFGKRFRLYSIASIVVLLAFGALTFLEAPRLRANLPTPWIGLWERINISVFLLWVVVLATVLLRTGTSKERRHVSPISVQDS